MRHTEVNALSIPKGTSNINELLFQDQVPSRLVLGFVKSKAYNGSYTENPFNFRHFGINFLRVTINGDPVSGHPLQLKFNGAKDQEYMDAYLNLFRATLKFDNDSGNVIQLIEFTNGFTLFVIDIDPVLTLTGVENCLRPDKSGMVRVETKFNNALPETINVIAYAEFICI